MKELLVKNLSRPLRILFTEPIVLLVTLYMSFIYGLLYLTLTAFELIFGDVHGFSLGVEGLPYMALIVGVLVALAIIVFQNRSYVKKLEANNNIPVPEWRMPIVMPGGIAFAAGKPARYPESRPVQIPTHPSLLTPPTTLMCSFFHLRLRY